MTVPEQDEAQFAPGSLLVDSTEPISISPFQYQLYESLHSNNILIKPGPTHQTLKQAPSPTTFPRTQDASPLFKNVLVITTPQ